MDLTPDISRFHDLVERLEREAEARGSPQERSEALYAVGRYCEDVVWDREPALGLYRRAHAAYPTNRRPLSRARAVCREMGRMDELVELAELELRRAEDSARKAELRVLAGEAMLDMGRRDEALDLLRAAVSDGDGAAAREVLAAAESNPREVDEQLARIREAAQAAAGADAARLWVRAARLIRLWRGDLHAEEQLLRQALAADPGYERAYGLVEEVLSREERWAELWALQEKRAAASAAPAARAAVWARFARGWDRRRDAARAAEAIARALGEAAQGKVTPPNPVATLSRLGELANKSGELARFLELVDQVLAGPLGEEARAHAAWLAARVAGEVLGDEERRNAYLAHAGMGFLIAKEEQPETVVDEPLPGLVISDEQRALVEAARAVPTVDAGGVDRSIAAWRKAIAAGPAVRGPRRELARLLRRGERWSVLAEALKDEEAKSCGNDEERAAVLLELVEVYRDRLHMETAVTQILSQVLSLRPDDLSLMDQLAAQYERAKRWSELATLLARKAGLVEAPAERLALFRRCAQLYGDRLGNQAEAIRAWEAALELDAGDDEIAATLGEAYVKRRDWEKLVALERRRAARLADPAARATELARLARMAGEMIRKPAPAIEAWRDVLGVEPAHEEALAALQRLYERERSWPELAEVLAAEASVVADPARRVAAWVRLAEVAEDHLDDPARAAAAWRDVLAVDPAHPRARKAVIAGYTAARRWQELEAFLAADPAATAAILEGQVEVVPEAERPELLSRLASLYVGALGREDAARGALERRLDLLPGDLAAAEALIPLYQRAGEGRKLGGVLWIQAEETTDPALLHARLIALAGLEEALGDAAAALRARLRAFPFDRGAAARAELERLAGACGAWRELADTYRVASDLPDSAPADARAMRAAAAVALAGELHDGEAALALRRRALELDPADAEALDATEQLHAAGARWQELRALLERRLALTEAAAARRRILADAARISEERLGDDPGALAAWRQVLADAPDDADGLAALDRILARREAWGELAEVLRRRIARAPSSDLRFRLAELCRGRLGDPEGAVAELERVLQSDPGHTGARAALEAVLEDPAAAAAHPRAAAILEPVYEVLGEHERLADALIKRVDGEARADARVALLHRVADLEERLKRPERAFAALGRALQEDPADDSTLDRLERAADAGKGWEELLALYRDLAGRSLPLDRQIDMRLRIGRLYVRLGNSDKAVATFTRVVDLDGGNARALAALRELHLAAGRWADFVEVAKRELPLCEGDSERSALEHGLARVYVEKVNDVAGALALHRSTLERDALHGPTLASLEDLYQRGERRQEIAALLEPLLLKASEWERLLKLWESQLAALAEPAARVELLRKMARVAERNLDDGVRAAGCVARALADAPGDEELCGEAERLADANEGWQDLAVVYRGLARGEARGAILVRLAQLLHERLGDAERARDVWLELLELEPAHAAALAALDAHYEKAGDAARLADILDRRIASGGDVAALGMRLGGLCADRLADPARAEAAWRRVLDKDPQHRGALDALERLFEGVGAWRELHAVLERQAELPLRDAERAGLYARLARLDADRLDDPAGAQARWDKVIDLRGEDAEALAALADLHARRDDWRETATVLERLILVTAGEAERVALFLRLGALWGEKLGREGNALEAYLRAREVRPQDPEILRALAGLYRTREAWTELAEVLQALLEAPGAGLDRAGRRALLGQLGRLQGDTLGFPDASAKAWEAALALDPADEEALAALDALYAREARWEERARTLERRAAVIEEPARRSETLIDAASMWDKAGDRARAAACLEQVAAAHPGDLAALTALEAIYRDDGPPAKLARVLDERVRYTGQADERLGLRREIARVQEGAGDPGAALEALLAAFAETPAWHDLADDMARLAGATGRWSDVLGAWETHAEARGAGDRDLAIEIWLRAARAWDEEVCDVERAAAAALQARGLDPEQPETSAAADELVRRREEEKDPVEGLGRRAARETRPERRAKLYLSLGDLLENERDDLAGAITAWTSALEADPASAPAAAALERAYRALGAWAELTALLTARLSGVSDTEERAALLAELGALLEERVGDLAAAMAQRREALALRPDDLPSLRALQRLSERADLPDELVAAADREVALVATVGEKAEALRRAAAALAGMGRADLAGAALERAIELDVHDEATHDALERLHAGARAWDALEAATARHAAAVARARRPAVWLALGRVLDDADLVERANAALRRAADGDEGDADARGAVDLLAASAARAGDWTAAAAWLEKLAMRAPGPEERTAALERLIAAKRAHAKHPSTSAADAARLLAEAGRIARAELHDDGRAVALWEESLTRRADQLELLVEVRDLHEARGDWARAVEAATALAVRAPSPLERARALAAVGALAGGHGLADAAAEAYDRALDGFVQARARASSDAELAATLDALDALLTARGDLRGVERAYLRMIEGSEPAAAQPLWRRLAQVYRDLGDEAAAARAEDSASGRATTEWTEVVISGLPSRPAAREEWDAISSASRLPAPADPEHEARARLAADPFAGAPHRDLATLYLERGDLDRAYHHCQALVVLDAARPDERRLSEKLAPRGLIRASRRLADAWDGVAHGDLDPLLGRALAAIVAPAIRAHAKPREAYGLDPAERRPVAQDPLRFSKIVYYLSMLLDMPPPELYLFPKQPGEIVLAHCEEGAGAVPAFVVGSRLLEGRSDRETAYVVGNKLASVRREHHLRAVLPGRAQLEAVLLAALTCVDPELPVDAARGPLVKRHAARLAGAVAAARDLFVEAAAAYRADPARFDLGRWANAVDATCRRVGLVLCGDLPTAAAQVAAEPAAPGSPTSRERLQDLLLFAVSDAHAALRRHLGVAIGG